THAGSPQVQRGNRRGRDGGERGEYKARVGGGAARVIAVDGSVPAFARVVGRPDAVREVEAHFTGEAVDGDGHDHAGHAGLMIDVQQNVSVHIRRAPHE